MDPARLFVEESKADVPEPSSNRQCAIASLTCAAAIPSNMNWPTKTPKAKRVNFQDFPAARTEPELR